MIRSGTAFVGFRSEPKSESTGNEHVTHNFRLVEAINQQLACSWNKAFGTRNMHRDEHAQESAGESSTGPGA